MATVALLAYISYCISMAIGISIDILFATLARYKKPLSIKTWVLPIIGTHTLLPAAGFYLVGGLQEAVPELRFLLGLAGFTLVTLFIYEEISEKLNHKPVFAICGKLSELLPIQKSTASSMIAVMAVSWDALLSGPSLAAGIKAAHWGFELTAASFIIVGLGVAIITFGSFWFTLWLRKRNFHDAELMANVHLWGECAGFSVIGGFGVLSLRQGFFETGDLYSSIFFSGIIIVGIFGWFKEELLHTEREEAHEIFD